MKFWDSSAIVPLLVNEVHSKTALKLFKEDHEIWVWWGTSIECISALSRREREGALLATDVAKSVNRLNVLEKGWNQIEPSLMVRDTARRLLRTHVLAADDALQLAAAITASEGNPETITFICFDERLSDAAAKEGFVIA